MSITYLLGAGASANNVPIVRKFPAQIRSLHRQLELIQLPDTPYDEPPFNQVGHTKKAAADIFLKDLKELADVLEKNVSFDTYAKILYLTHAKPEFRKLKALLDMFLCLWQLFYGVDKRYDLFFASIMEGGFGKALKLPDKIKILSWNYDFQPELSAKKLFGVRDLDRAQQQLNTFVNSKNSPSPSLDKFSLIKLNGTSGGWIDKDALKHISHGLPIEKVGDELNVEDKKHLLEITAGLYYWLCLLHGPAHSSITYAWEENNYAQTLKDVALKHVTDTQVLVVIGYSFPTFNRDFDKAILAEMKKLKKVYLQNTLEAIEGIKVRMKPLLGSRADIKIELVPSVEEFHIPDEY